MYSLEDELNPTRLDVDDPLQLKPQLEYSAAPVKSRVKNCAMKQDCPLTISRRLLFDCFV
jgi:hypothetical protein